MPDRQAELLGDVLGGQQAGGGAVVEAGGVARGDPAVRTRNGVFSVGQPSIVVPGRGASSAVARPQPFSAWRTAIGTRYGLDLAVGVRPWRTFSWEASGERVGALLGDVREAVVQVLRGRAHDQRGGVDELLGDDARVGVDALAHRVAAHVLDAAGDGDVVGAEGDAAGHGGHGGHRAGAHPVDGVARARSWAARPAARRCGRWSGPGRRSAWWRRWRPRRPAPAAGSGCAAAARGCTRITRSSARVSAYMPLGPALPNGVRTPSTKTTSRAVRGTITLPR